MRMRERVKKGGGEKKGVAHRMCTVPFFLRGDGGGGGGGGRRGGGGGRGEEGHFVSF